MLIFNGRSQSSSLDSLRLVYPTWVGEYINIKISQDGNWLATTNNKSKLLTLWNLKNRKMVYTYRFEGSVDDLDFDKEEKLNLTTYEFNSWMEVDYIIFYQLDLLTGILKTSKEFNPKFKKVKIMYKSSRPQFIKKVTRINNKLRKRIAKYHIKKIDTIYVFPKYVVTEDSLNTSVLLVSNLSEKIELGKCRLINLIDDKIYVLKDKKVFLINLRNRSHIEMLNFNISGINLAEYLNDSEFLLSLSNQSDVYYFNLFGRTLIRDTLPSDLHICKLSGDKNTLFLVDCQSMKLKVLKRKNNKFYNTTEHDLIDFFKGKDWMGSTVVYSVPKMTMDYLENIIQFETQDSLFVFQLDNFHKLFGGYGPRLDEQHNIENKFLYPSNTIIVVDYSGRIGNYNLEKYVNWSNSYDMWYSKIEETGLNDSVSLFFNSWKSFTNKKYTLLSDMYSQSLNFYDHKSKVSEFILSDTLESTIDFMRIAPDNNSFFTKHFDNKLNIYSRIDEKKIYSLTIIDSVNWLVKLSNTPYYMCSKNASKMLHYVTPSLKVIGFDQLDPVYNRPDIVLDSIGKYFDGVDRGMIDLYKKSWEKRIDRLGLDKEKLGKGEISVPNAEFVGAEDIAPENTSGQLELKVEAKDPRYTLRRFNILVNEVPLYGSEGISIASRGLREWDTTISVPLGAGENKIQVSVMNELGLENFKYPSYVNYTPPENHEIVSKTYFIGIGVDEFEEAGHDLSYCVKDIEDLSNAFKSSNNTESIVLTNERVTKENILALKNTLKKTSVHDKVIISCSSHGLLDDQKRFYLATHDVDFSHPEDKGLPYAELEGLLDSIPARQKLLMLDACNSGENEIEQSKRPIAKTTNTNNENQGKKKVGRGEILVDYEQEFQSSFETMMELFVNVSNETGSVIISAAGGKQSALEGEAVKIDGKKIENGAFTYSVLEYLQQTDETLTVNGLKSYVEKRVEEITKGKQRPTSRQETMEVDWDLR